MSAERTFYAGVDGGGTKTLAVVVDDTGQERGRMTAGSGNYAAVGLQQAVENIAAAVSGAAGLAGAAPPLTGVWIGLAGVDRPADSELLLPHLCSLGTQVRLTNDAELVLTGLDRAIGVAVISGTGSIALGRDASGQQIRAAGWGHLLGDEGSGWEIGRHALRAVARAADGRGAPTALVEAVMNAWGLESPYGMIGKVYPDTNKALVAGITSVVLACFRAGDQVAGGILEHAADELALNVSTVANQLQFEGDRVPLALAGGLLVNEADFREMVLDRVRAKHQLGQVALVRDSALSAARAARELLEGTQ